MRLDERLVSDGLCESRQRAQALIMAGAVLVSGQVVSKAGQKVGPEVPVQVMLQREAAALGRTVAYRVIVNNFEAAMRVVRAGLAISVVPREVATLYAKAYGVRVVTLQESTRARSCAPATA